MSSSNELPPCQTQDVWVPIIFSKHRRDIREDRSPSFISTMRCCRADHNVECNEVGGPTELSHPGSGQGTLMMTPHYTHPSHCNLSHCLRPRQTSHNSGRTGCRNKAFTEQLVHLIGHIPLWLGIVTEQSVHKISSKEMKKTPTQVTAGVRIPTSALNYTDMVRNNFSTAFARSQIACF